MIHKHSHETFLTQIKRDIKFNNNSGIRTIFYLCSEVREKSSGRK